MVRSFIERVKQLLMTGDSSGRSLITRRFIIAVSCIYGVLILATAVSFYAMMHVTGTRFRDAIETNRREHLLGRAGLILDRIGKLGETSPGRIAEEMAGDMAARHELLAAVIFTKTEDENYHRVAGIATFREGFPLNVKKSEVVRELKEINHVKSGMLQPVFDNEIYSQDGYYWQNVYAPVAIGRNRAVIQMYFSAARTHEMIAGYGRAMMLPRLAMLAATLALSAAVILLTAVFTYNYSYLIRNLSEYMNKAARGNLDVSLRKTGDGELNLLAESFNTLIDELKDRSGTTVQDSEGIGSMFSTGVTLLKENRLDDAIAVFRTLTILKPNGFGSFFNLGVAHAKRRDYQRAIEMFREAERINPGFEMTAKYIERLRRFQETDA